MADEFGIRNPGFFAVHTPLFDGAAGDGTGQGNAGAAGSGQGGGQQQAAQQNPSGGGQQPQGQQPVAGAQAGEKTYSFKEDRSDWIPRTRLNETSGKLTAAEKRARDAEVALEQERKRTRALAGVENVDPKTAEAEEIKSALYKMFPQLETLEGLSKEQLQQVLAAATTAQSTSRASWERHALGMLNDLDTEAAEKLGTEKLTATQQKNLRRAYRDEAVQAMAARQEQLDRHERNTLETLPGDTDFVARHERGDKTLLKEFVKAFLDDWYEPARRSVTTQQARRQMRPVPRGERTRTAIAQGAPNINYNDPDAFKKALMAARGSSE